MKILEVKKVHKTFGEGDTAVHAVNDVSLSVHSGEIVLIMGPSGSGKTTLLSIIGGLLTPSSGSVNVNGNHLHRMKKKELSAVRLREIGFVFQSFNILENLSAMENVQIVGQLAGMTTEDAVIRAEELLTKLHLDHRLQHLPATLSGGQQQRVAIARALINNPQLILADEPTGNLDSKSGHEVMMLFHNIAKEEGRSVVIVSHDDRIKDIADRVLWIEDGKISDAPPAPEEKVKDVVCGMQVDKKYTPFKKKFEDTEYFFCSKDCVARFDAQPSRFTHS